MLHHINYSMWSLQEGRFAESAMLFYPRRGTHKMPLHSTAWGCNVMRQKSTTHTQRAASAADAAEAEHTGDSEKPGY